MAITKTESVLHDIYTKLCEPLPAESLKQHPSKTYLTTINPMYVVDRLNVIFGIGKWQMRYDIIETEGKMPVVKGTLTVPDYSVHIEQFGGSDNSDRGDAWKGAATDALTKCASYLGIGRNVWMNIKAEAPQATDADINKIMKLCDELGLSAEDRNTIEVKVRPGITKDQADKATLWIRSRMKEA